VEGGGTERTLFKESRGIKVAGELALKGVGERNAWEVEHSRGILELFFSGRGSGVMRSQHWK